MPTLIIEFYAPEFRRLGYDFNIKTLCTVELSKKLLPEQPSHSLGKLVRALGIPNGRQTPCQRRCHGNCEIVQMLLDKDLNKEIVKELIKFEVQKGITPKLMDIVESLPSKTGIYYIHRKDGSLILLAKAETSKKELTSILLELHEVRRKSSKKFLR